MLRFKNARRDARRLGYLPWDWFGLCRRSLGLCLGRPNRELHQEARGQRRTDPYAVADMLADCAPLGPLSSIPGTALSGVAPAFQIEHWIRHALRDCDSCFPYFENLPMGMSAESIG